MFGIMEQHRELDLSIDEHVDFMNPAVTIFEVEDDAMAPTIGKGDLLLYNSSRKATSGALVIVEMLGEVFCRRLIWRQGRPLLKAFKRGVQEMDLNEDHNFLGVVTWKLAKHSS